ncbi:secreted protein [Melampsora americana]|nr:secreted protein [Melampsora americana]
MLVFIPFITALLFLSTTSAASHQKKPDPNVQQCGRSWGEFANVGPGNKACLNYGSVHYSCPTDSCAIGKAPADNEKSKTPNPTFTGCQKFLGAFGDDKNLDPNLINIIAVSYYFNFEQKWLRANGYDAALPSRPAVTDGYRCDMPAHPSEVIEVCRNCTLVHGATW